MGSRVFWSFDKKNNWLAGAGGRSLHLLGGPCSTSRWLLVLGWRPQHHVILYTVGWHVLTFVAQRNFDDNFSPHVFSLSSTSKRLWWLCKIAKWSSIFNCIEFDLFVFQFHLLTFDFLCFFN